MPYTIGANNPDPVLVCGPGSREVDHELRDSRGNRERRELASSRPCGGFMLGSNGDYLLGSGN